MNMPPSVNVFPSYRVIQQETQQKYIQKYQNKIKNIQNHLSSLKKNHDFERDHQEIQFSIMTLASQNNEQAQYQKGNVKVIPQQGSRYRNSGQYGESLNYYLEDDGEQENNYQTYLKFKKKTLQRDLQQELKARGSRGNSQKKKEKAEEEQFFKNLYASQADKQSFLPKRCSSANKINQKKQVPTFNYKESKENTQSFLRKLDKKTAKSKKQLLSTMRKVKQSRKDVIDSQIASYQKNKKYLTENYLQILKKLDNTNIVKWRVLNAQGGSQQ